MSSGQIAPTVVWEPQPGPQTALINCPVFEVLFGGARGGGKTDGMLGEWATHASKYGKDAIGLMLRRSRTELMETIERSKAIYGPLAAKFEGVDKQWRFPNGARLKFAYLENDSDANHYQGHSYTRVYIEELGNFHSESTVLKLMATLRSGAGVPCGFRATANPGGVGHMWIKQRYIDAAPQGWVPTVHEYPNPITGGVVTRDRIYIPSRITDNKILINSDPNYIANLQMQGSPELVRAWLEGDWSIIAGTAFEKLSREKHIIRPFEIPYWWTRFTSLDWGTAKPYSVGWYAVCGEDVLLKERDGFKEKLICKDSIILYREMYGWNGKPDQGTREESRDVAKRIHDVEGSDERIDYRIADSAMWAEHDGPSAAENMERAFRNLRAKCPYMERSRKDRRANYLELRHRFASEDGRQAGLYTFPDCFHFWRTMPELQLDQRQPEKGWDTNQEDHVADQTGYAMASRPLVMDRGSFDEAELKDIREKSFAAEKGYSGRSHGRYT